MLSLSWLTSSRAPWGRTENRQPNPPSRRWCHCRGSLWPIFYQGQSGSQIRLSLAWTSRNHKDKDFLPLRVSPVGDCREWRKWKTDYLIVATAWKKLYLCSTDCSRRWDTWKPWMYTVLSVSIPTTSHSQERVSRDFWKVLCCRDRRPVRWDWWRRCGVIWDTLQFLI